MKFGSKCLSSLQAALFVKALEFGHFEVTYKLSCSVFLERKKSFLRRLLCLRQEGELTTGLRKLTRRRAEVLYNMFDTRVDKRTMHKRMSNKHLMVIIARS